MFKNDRDYFVDTAAKTFRPDLLLNDFIVMAHPEIDQLKPLRYFKKVRE